jgi:inorganic phosphate transporter, PiT family
MLLALAGVFAVVNGANDGGAMLAVSLKAPGLRLITAIAFFAAALAVVPGLLGGGVAQTLTSGLVDAPRSLQPRLLGIGALAAMVVVTALTVAGLPTSLTLGTVGGIVGGGVGHQLPIALGSVGRVLLVGIAAPVAGALLAQVLTVLAALAAGGSQRRLAWAHRVATALQAVAYAANDGQKMLALLAVTAVGVTLPALVAIAVLFAIGTVLGLAGSVGALGGRILRTSPREEVTAQLAGSTAVLISAALGAPVSMTQAVAGGLIGTGLRRGPHQVRWRVAGQLALAWILTLPTAALAGGIVGWISGRAV